MAVRTWRQSLRYVAMENSFDIGTTLSRMLGAIGDTKV